MVRYSVINRKLKREIVLLKGRPCLWGRCRFCDYIEDNSPDDEGNRRLNDEVLDRVTGEFGVLEVINSGNIFELPQATLDRIKELTREKGIHTLMFEAHWVYRKQLTALREFFGTNCMALTGVESFDRDFREGVLNKGCPFCSIEELKSYFDSVCLMVGVEGQNREMIARDIEIARENFDHFTVNVYVNNTTPIKADPELIDWFREEYAWLEDYEKCDVLWNNTDFGVGGD
ncbi:MAG: hypothetical protein PQJ59_05770 [Spirochaetales bacterium]|nr:hypothetical protein [Spirochaetales bacterium]